MVECGVCMEPIASNDRFRACHEQFPMCNACATRWEKDECPGCRHAMAVARCMHCGRAPRYHEDVCVEVACDACSNLPTVPTAT